MTETEFGPGGYSYTEAAVPSAPVLEEESSITIRVTVGDDSNPDYTEYAVYNETAEKYLDAAGNSVSEPVWQTADAWGTVTAQELTPSVTYTLRVKARNREEVETVLGPSAHCSTYHLDSQTIAACLVIEKSSSTISEPHFMSGLEPSIRLAGKNMHDFGFYVDRISGLDLPRILPDEELVPGSHTWLVWDEYFTPKHIVLEGYIHGVSPDDLRLRVAYLKSFLATFEGNPWRSTAPVKLERTDLPDRYWEAYYESIDALETLGKRDNSSSASLRVTMKCPTPYALSNDVIRVAFDAPADTFTIIDLGNAPSDAVYVVKGASENPSFSVGDMVFHCDFSNGLSFTDMEHSEHEGTFTPGDNEAGAYRTTDTGTGILVTGTDTVSFTAKGNTSDGSWIAVFTPEWQSTSQASDVTILEHRADEDNYLRLYWDGSEQRWVFRKRVNAVESEVATGMQAFTAGTKMILGITYDSTNAGGMKIFADGVQSGVEGNLEILESIPDTLTLHGGDGTMQPDVVFDLIAGWSRMLSADEMLKIASNPSAVANLNATMTYTGTLDEDDLLTLDSKRKTAELFDVSAGTRTNALDAVTGSIPVLTPGRRKTASDRTQTVLYIKNTAVRMEVIYRRRYL